MTFTVHRPAMRILRASSLALATTLAGVSAFGQTTSETAAAPPGSDPAQAAQDPTVDQARDAFTLGTSLANQGEWPEALRAFERSSKLRPHPVTTYNVAYCERSLGHYTRAYKLFLRSLAEHDSGATGKLPDDLLALAKSYGSEVEHRLAHVFVRIATPGTAVSVDGRPLEAATASAKDRVLLMAGTRDDRGNEAPSASSFELLIDPGRHLFVSARPGAPDQVVSETFESGTSRELVLGAASEPTPKTSAAPVKVSAEPPSGSSKKTWAYVSYAVGGAGLVTGSIFGILAIDKKSYLDSDGRCTTPQKCLPEFQDDIDTANLYAWVATGGFVLAGVGAGLGTYLLLTSDSEKAGSEKRTSTIEPVIGPTMIGARGRF
jgi:hypothetical protein